MHILLDPQNKSVPEFFIYRKIQDGRQWSKVQNRPNLTPQITFRLGIWFPFIRFWLNLVWTYYLTLQTSLRNNLALIAKCKMAGEAGSKVKNHPNLTPQITFWLGIWISFIRFGHNLAWTYFLPLQTSLHKNLPVRAISKISAGGQGSKIYQISPHKSHSGFAFRSRPSDLDTIWHEHTSCPYKQVCARIYQSGQNQRWPPEVKVQNLPNLTPKNIFQLGIWIPFIRFRPSLAWTYFLTL